MAEMSAAAAMAPQQAYDDSRMRQPIRSSAASASAASYASPATAINAASEQPYLQQAYSAEEEDTQQPNLVVDNGADAGPPKHATVPPADDRASAQTGMLPAADVMLPGARVMPSTSHATNAFDAALGFGHSQLEAASISMFEAGLEGHLLPNKIAMVRQRLDLEQDRLASGVPSCRQCALH